MEELYNYNLNDSDIKEMIYSNPEILYLDKEEIIALVNILIKINCSEKQIRNILLTNPFYLSRCISDIKELIKRFNELNLKTLNILFDTNPWLLNKDVFEIDNYINKKINHGYILEEIILNIDNNPFIIDEEEYLW